MARTGGPTESREEGGEGESPPSRLRRWWRPLPLLPLPPECEDRDSSLLLLRLLPV